MCMNEKKIKKGNQSAKVKTSLEYIQRNNLVLNDLIIQTVI